MQIYAINTDEHRKETTRHGSFEFPIAVYENVIARKNLGYINWHWHDELQFFYVTEGKVTVFLNGSSEVIDKGQGMIVNSGVMHMAKDMHDSQAAYICVDFDPGLLSSFPGSIFERKYVAPFVNNQKISNITLRGESDDQRDILDSIYDIYLLYNEAEFGYELEIMSRLAHIWNLIMSNITSRIKDLNRSDQDGEDYHRRLRAIVSFMQRHYDEKLTLDDIARHVHLSRNECCRFFKKNMNVTLFEYLIDYRLSKSMELLENTSLSVTRIAYETGFGSSSYYIEKFREKTAMTPGEFRKKNFSPK